VSARRPQPRAQDQAMAKGRRQQCFTWSGVTNCCPSKAAYARAASISKTSARVLAPSAISGAVRVAMARFTTYDRIFSSSTTLATWPCTTRCRPHQAPPRHRPSPDHAARCLIPSAGALHLVSRGWIVEPDLEEEAILLRLGQRIVPSYSIGFCVARTKKGAGSASCWPSSVTPRSSIASRRPTAPSPARG